MVLHQLCNLRWSLWWVSHMCLRFPFGVSLCTSQMWQLQVMCFQDSIAYCKCTLVCGRSLLLIVGLWKGALQVLYLAFGTLKLCVPMILNALGLVQPRNWFYARDYKQLSLGLYNYLWWRILLSFCKYMDIKALSEIILLHVQF